MSGGVRPRLASAMPRSLAVLLALTIVREAPAGLIAYQGFEGRPTDTFGYAHDPGTYVDDPASPKEQFRVTDAVDNFIGPESGDFFWGLHNLRKAGGDPILHRLDFDSLDLRGVENVTLSFAWSALLFDSGDTLGYTVNGEAGTLRFDETRLSFADPWRTKDLPIDDSVTELNLSLTASRDKLGYFGGWDSVTVTGDVVDVAAVPEPAAAWLFGAAALGGWGARRRRRLSPEG